MMLDQKTIIITGGSMGIGLEVAKKCVSVGARIVILAREKKNIDEALILINKISNKDHIGYQLDVSQANKIEHFVQWCKKNTILPDGLVNCAGIYGPIGKTTEVSYSEFQKAININFMGTVAMCMLVIPILNSRFRKKVVNFAGGGAASPFPFYSAYATSKAAIVRFTENIALEFQDENIDINSIAPGFVVTRLHKQTLNAGSSLAGDKFYQATLKQVADGGVPPEKAAELTSYLLSDLSNGITGKFISAPWDPWQESDFQKLLRSDKDIATTRRIDNKKYITKD